MAARSLALAPARGDGLPAANGRAGLDALHRALADFAAPAPVRFTPFAPEPAPAAPPAAAPGPAASPERMEARIAQAVEEAEARLRARLEAEGRAALETALKEALEAERQSHALALTDALHRSGELAAETIGSRFSALSAEVEANLGAACARLLLPLAGEALARRAAAEMAEAVRNALNNESRPRIAVSGPASLLDGLRDRLGEAGAAVEWRETDGFDLVASFDGQVIETRLGLWAAKLRAELDGEAS